MSISVFTPETDATVIPIANAPVEISAIAASPFILPFSLILSKRKAAIITIGSENSSGEKLAAEPTVSEPEPTEPEPTAPEPTTMDSERSEFINSLKYEIVQDVKKEIEKDNLKEAKRERKAEDSER